MCLYTATGQHCFHERGFESLLGGPPAYKALCCWCGKSDERAHGPFLSGRDEREATVGWR